MAWLTTAPSSPAAPRRIADMPAARRASWRAEAVEVLEYGP